MTRQLLTDDGPTMCVAAAATTPLGVYSGDSSGPSAPQSQSQMTLASIKSKLLGAQQAALHSEQALASSALGGAGGLSHGSGGGGGSLPSAGKHSPALLKKSMNILAASMSARPLSAQAQSPLRRA